MKVKDEELLAQLEKYEFREEVKEEDEPEGVEDTFRMAPLSRLLFQAKTTQDLNLFQSLFRFKPRFQDSFLTALPDPETALALLGDVIDTIPSLERIERGQVADTLKVMFATRHSQGRGGPVCSKSTDPVL